MKGFKITALHQLELTSRCNLRCKYCPSPNLGRPKVDMTEEIFERALAWIKTFVARGTQREVNLAGIGESTLHPRFVEYVARVREAVGLRPEITLATNGILLDDVLARALAPYRPRVWVSLHRPERAGCAVEAARRAGILAGVSVDPSVAAMDWAGQVAWHVSHPPLECSWLSSGRAFVAADGRVLTCCLDATGGGALGTVFDDVAAMRLAPYALCEGCSYALPKEAIACRTMVS